MPEEVPAFEVVPPIEAKRRRRPRRSRRNWKPVIDALVAGRMLFLPDDELNDGNVKYLQLSLYRRGKGERLRTERTIRNDIGGRTMYVVREEPVTVTTNDVDDDVVEVEPEDVGSAPGVEDLHDIGLERMGL